MPPLTLEGATLGQRHRSLNQITDDTVRKQTPFREIRELPESSDADRLYKIDVAAKYRDLDYILYNLKSDDDLYMSRALKKSVWLVTEPQYANILNPDYLDKELFPSMTSKAIFKTLLLVRLHLKDEARAELFYKYVEGKRSKSEALKWLPSCSLEFIEEKMQVEHDDIDLNLFKRLCERSFNFFEIYCKKKSRSYRFRSYMAVAVFLLNTHTQEYLDIFEKLPRYEQPNLHKCSTAIILKKCPERVNKKIEIYIEKIDISTFARHLGAEKTKETILKLAKLKSLERWFSYSNLKPLIQKMPKENKFEFIKSVFIDKKICYEDDAQEDVVQCSYVSMSAKCSMIQRSMKTSVNLSSVYQWYRMAPFGTAFVELKKFIRSESSPDERSAMLKILVSSAGNNPENIHILMKYFREKHINEPAKFKAGFVSSLVETTDTHAYDDSTWKLFEEILHSLGLYSDDEDGYEIWNAVHSIVAYNVLHDVTIPEVILKKFNNNFIPFKKLAKKLGETEKKKLFNFLFGELRKKIDSKSLDKKDDFSDVVSTLSNLLDLLKHWNKNLAEFSYVLGLVRNLIEKKKYLKADDISLSNVYDTEKKWRRCLFEESLQLVQSEAVFMNALKHKPMLMLQQQRSLDKILKSNSFDLIRILRKLRTYFPGSIALDWLKMYERKLDMCRTEQAGCKAVTRGLCVLMEREEFSRMLKSYVPASYKVQWSEEDVAIVTLRKFFTQQMYLVRPTLQVDTVLLFARGDYLQYALPSLISVCGRKSKEECKTFLPTLLGGAVSLQKHGIRLAFDKMGSQEITDTFKNIWGQTKNASIRAVIFNLAFTLLCKQKNSARIQELWKLLQVFMRNLSTEENRTVYSTIAKVSQVPPEVQGEFCMLSYNILKALPAKLKCEDLADGLLNDIADIVDSIDDNFVMQILLKYVNETYVQKKILKKDANYNYDRDMADLIIKYLIGCRNVEIQSKRYGNVFKLITKHSLDMWDEIVQKRLKVRQRFQEFVKGLATAANALFEELEPKFVNPIGIFKSIQRDIDELSVESNYMFLTYLKLTICCCQAYSDIHSELKENADVNMAVEVGVYSEDEKWEEKNKYKMHLCQKIAPAFAERCLLILKEDLDRLFPSIRSLFADSLKSFLENHFGGFHSLFVAYVWQVFTADPDNVPACLVVASLHLEYEGYCEENSKAVFEEVRKKLEANPAREVQMCYHANLYKYRF